MKEKVKALLTDMNLSLEATPTFYQDSDHILEATENNLHAAYKKYGDIAYHMELKEDSFDFFCFTNLSFYRINIQDNSFTINISRIKNGKAYQNSIYFMSDEENQQSQIITQELCKDEDICDYINLEQKGDNVQITIANETDKTSIKNKKCLEDLQQIILDLERNNIKEMFMILNQKIPNFFNQIKSDFKVLSKFNSIFPEEKVQNFIRSK